jgi:glycine dehydrogenase
MLSVVGCESMEDLISQTVPANIRLQRPLELPEGRPEAEMLVRVCSACAT